MCVQTRKTHRSSEIRLLSLSDRVFVAVQMLFRETKIDNENLFEVLAQYKIGGFNISVYEISVVHLLNSL